MKNYLFTTTLAAMACTISAQAHDPSEHKDKGEKPQCAALEEMDLEKARRNDPVAQALIKKCMKQLHPNGENEKEDNGDEN